MCLLQDRCTTIRLRSFCNSHFAYAHFALARFAYTARVRVIVHTQRLSNYSAGETSLNNRRDAPGDILFTFMEGLVSYLVL